MYQQTKKHDYFTAALAADPQVFVGDTDLAHKLLGKPTGAAITLRYLLREADQQPVLVIVAKSDDPNFFPEHTETLRELHARIAGSYGCPVLLVTAPKTYIAPSGGRLGDAAANLRFSLLAGDQIRDASVPELAAHFAGAIAPLVSRSVGVEKQINRSIVDSFAVFTRIALTDEVAVNDFDAIRFDGELFASKGRILELRRVSESPASWLPYCSDHACYRGQQSMSELLGWHQPRVVTYSILHPGVAAAHRIDRASSAQVSGIRAICSAAAAGGEVIPGAREKYVSTRGARAYC